LSKPESDVAQPVRGRPAYKRQGDCGCPNPPEVELGVRRGAFGTHYANAAENTSPWSAELTDVAGNSPTMGASSKYQRKTNRLLLAVQK